VYKHTMGNKTPKPHRAIAIREIRLARPSKVKIEKVTAALSTLSRTSMNVEELQKQADLLHVEAVLVSEGMNDNDDVFTREELKRAISSPLLKPMNWQHDDEKILGAMYAVEARDFNGNTVDVDDLDDQPIELIVQGVIWHHLPHIKITAEQIVQRIEQGNLFVSMECWFDDYRYAFYNAAGEVHDYMPRNSATAFLDSHLRANGGTGKYNGMRIGRALSGTNFGGIAFVDKPANKRSFILNHFAFDPFQIEEVEANRYGSGQDRVLTNIDVSNEKPIMEVNMNDLNRAAASTEEVTKGVVEILDARDAAKAAQLTKVDRDTAVSRATELERELAQAKETLERLQAAIEQVYAGATSDTPAEIKKIDQALTVKGEGAGDATFAAKISWIADSRGRIAAALIENKSDEVVVKLEEENKALKAKLDSIESDLRKREIQYIFAEVLKMTEEEVAGFVKTGLAKSSDEEYNEWLDEKKILAKKLLELKKKNGKDKEAEKEKADLDAEAGLLSPTQRETPVEDYDAVLRGRNGRVPSDVPRTPRSKLTAARDLETMFEEVDEPNLAGATEARSDGESPMGNLVASLLPNNKKDKED